MSVHHALFPVVRELLDPAERETAGQQMLATMTEMEQEGTPALS
jgi:hypothetical protein